MLATNEAGGGPASYAGLRETLRSLAAIADLADYRTSSHYSDLPLGSFHTGPRGLSDLLIWASLHRFGIGLAVADTSHRSQYANRDHGWVPPHGHMADDVAWTHTTLSQQ